MLSVEVWVLVMARGKSHIKQSEVARATRGLLAAVSAAGLTGDIEVHLESGVVKFHMTGESGAGANAPTGTDINADEWK
jgi:hypothetical protein